MKKLQEFWDKRRVQITIVGAVAFVIALVVVAVGLMIGPGDSPDTGNEAKPTDTGTSAPETDTDAEADAEEVDVAAEPVLGSDGLVPMEVTTDPRVAAASAAQVLMSVDTAKVEWAEDFREEALSRVMRPSPEFVGAGAGLVVDQIGADDLDGDDLINQAPQMHQKLNYSPTGWWWLLGDDKSFNGFKSYSASLLSRAADVYDQEEMTEYTGGVHWTEPSDAISVDIAEDAYFGLWWVRVETTTTTGESVTTMRNPVALAIYCDPPAEGGICGMAATTTKYPTGWRTSY